MAIGKFGRYLVMTAALLWVFPGQYARRCRRHMAIALPASRDDDRRLRTSSPRALSAAAPLQPPAVDRRLGPGRQHAATGNEARAAALAEMAALLHRLRTEPRLARADRARRAGAAHRRRSAPTCARCGAHWRQSNALPARLVQRAVARHLALRTRLAHAATGERLGRLSPQPARGARDRAGGGEALADATRPVAVRRADGPLRTRHDRRRGGRVCSATCVVAAGAGSAGHRRAGERDRGARRAARFRWPRSARCATR